MIGPIISFPIPAYANVPIQPQYYQPRFWFISTITNGTTTLVTTTTTQDFVIGQLVNERQGYVLSILSSTQVEVDIDSSFMDLFTTSSATTQPQIIPVGDLGNGTINATGRRNTGTFIPGSFINISPN